MSLRAFTTGFIAVVFWGCRGTESSRNKDKFDSPVQEIKPPNPQLERDKPRVEFITDFEHQKKIKVIFLDQDTASDVPHERGWFAQESTDGKCRLIQGNFHYSEQNNEEETSIQVIVSRKKNSKGHCGTWNPEKEDLLSVDKLRAIYDQCAEPCKNPLDVAHNILQNMLDYPRELLKAEKFPDIAVRAIIISKAP